MLPPKTFKNQCKINIFRPEPFRNLLQPSQSSLEAPESLLQPPKCSLEDPPAPWRPRARSPAGLNTGPRFFWPACLHKLITDSSFSLYLKLPGWCSELFKRHRASWRPQALSRPSSRKLSGQAPARAETSRPQNWSPAFLVCIINDGPSTQSSCQQMADCQARWRDRSSAALWIYIYIYISATALRATA